MGVCTVEDEKNRPKFRKIFNNEECKNSDLENSKLSRKKSSNNNIIDISLNSKKTIIKLIGEIKSKPIKIKSNIDCKILIMENSSSITIENCKNCSILLAPCASTIAVENCENLNLICASLNIKLINVKKGNIYLFSMNPVIIEDCENIYLGNFFFQYMELPEMFINSKLNIWNNKWSIYEEEGKNKNINYSNDFIKQGIIDIFRPTFNECYINFDQYQFMPYTYGKSLKKNNIDEQNINYTNFMILIKQEDFQESELLKILLPDELENYNMKLIATLGVGEKSEKIKEFFKKLELNKNNNSLINYILTKSPKDGLFESFQSSMLKSSTNKSRLNEIDLSNNEYMNINYKFLRNDDILFLWLVNCDEDFNDIKTYFNNFFEPIKIDIITKETFGWNENEFEKYLNSFFEFEKND